ncbi:MAG: hypothetical protein EHM87_22765 [Burkholderiales bacterium]|nr:MAG: hypothetical protein EHM87_22765 [Burkholderiales bacterium]
MRRIDDIGLRVTNLAHSVEAMAADEKVPFAALEAALMPLSRDILCLVLIVPFLQPIPVWGVSSFLGLAVALLHIQVVLKGEAAAFPNRIQRFTLTAKHLLVMLHGAQRILKVLAKAPEFKGPVFSKLAQARIVSVQISILGLFLTLPLPVPASNMIPALGILFFVVGILAENVVFLLAGYLSFFLNILFFGALAVFPVVIATWFGWR